MLNNKPQLAIMHKLLLSLGIVSMIFLGCAKAPKPDSALLIGSWSGEEAGRPAGGTATLVVDGTSLEFHGANPNEWYKATFSLREDTTPKQLVATITECPLQAYVGKRSSAIYQVTDDSLTLSANEPGNPAVPTSFDAPGARKIVFKRK